MNWILIGLALVAVAVGVWIGIGAPGWPAKPKSSRRRLEKRPINPISWKRQDPDRSRRRR